MAVTTSPAARYCTRAFAIPKSQVTVPALAAAPGGTPAPDSVTALARAVFSAVETLALPDAVAPTYVRPTVERSLVSTSVKPKLPVSVRAVGSASSTTAPATSVGVTTGAWFEPVIVTVTSWVSVAPWLSVTVTVYVSVSVSPRARYANGLAPTVSNDQPMVPLWARLPITGLAVVSAKYPASVGFDGCAGSVVIVVPSSSRCTAPASTKTAFT